MLVGENGGEYVIPADGLSNPTLLPFVATMEEAQEGWNVEEPELRGGLSCGSRYRSGKRWVHWHFDKPSDWNRLWGWRRSFGKVSDR